MKSNGKFGRLGRKRASPAGGSAVVALDQARFRKHAWRYLPLAVGAAGFSLTLFFPHIAAEFLSQMPGKAVDLFNRATTSVDNQLSTQSAVSFGLCPTGGGTNCVVDGDTFWIKGVKVRISDIDAPETHPSRCAHEADLGARATYRLQALLNDGPIELRAGSRDEDVYGRKLRIVSRDGKSFGMQLVSEGLARQWDGAKHPWCPSREESDD